MKKNLKNGLAAQGYDVVSFHNNSPAKGSDNYRAEYDGGTYLLDSDQNRKTFEADPEKYDVQYGGYCAIAMSEGKEADPNPKSWEIRDGKLYFFTRMLWGIMDVKRQWVKDPETKRNLADAEWKKMNS